MKRIGVISDTHLEMYDPCIEDIAVRYFSDVDIIVHAGDMVALDVLQPLERPGRDIVAVCGNMDGPEVRGNLPTQRTIFVEEVAVGIIHGWGSPNSIRQRIKSSFSDVDAIIYGHTHQPFSGWESGIFFFNPGSPTDSRFTSGRSIGIIEVHGKAIEGVIVYL